MARSSLLKEGQKLLYSVVCIYTSIGVFLPTDGCVCVCVCQEPPPSPLDKVRRKLGASLRGKEHTPPGGEISDRDVAGVGGGSADDGSGASSRRLSRTVGEANADDSRAPVTLPPPPLVVGGLVSEVMPVVPTDAGNKAEGGKEGAPGAQIEEEEGDLDRPILLSGAMEMLASALVALPPGDLEGAMQCVG